MKRRGWKVRKQVWSDRELEELLQQMPQIKDSRNQLEIYKNIRKKMKKKQKTLWLIPSLATIVSVCILLMLIPSFSSQFENQSMNSVKKEHSDQSNEMMVHDSAELAKQSADMPLMSEDEIEHRFVVQQGENFVTFGLPDPHALTVIPVSMMIKNDGRSLLDHYKELMNQLNEESLGLDKFPLKNMDFEGVNENSNIKINIPSGYALTSSAQTETLRKVIVETFRWNGFKSAQIYSNGHSGVEFGNEGFIKNIPIASTLKKAYYLYMYKENDPKFLAPSANSFISFESALKSMESENFSNSPPLHASIPIGVDIDKVEEDGTQVIVYFTRDSKFTNNELYSAMIDAIMMTAKEFGYQTVKFKGAAIENIGKIKLNKEIPVPAAPNPINLLRETE
jgi:hypothetical protein